MSYQPVSPVSPINPTSYDVGRRNSQAMCSEHPED